MDGIVSGILNLVDLSKQPSNILGHSRSFGRMIVLSSPQDRF